MTTPMRRQPQRECGLSALSTTPPSGTIDELCAPLSEVRINAVENSDDPSSVPRSLSRDTAPLSDQENAMDKRVKRKKRDCCSPAAFTPKPPSLQHMKMVSGTVDLKMNEA